jgi:hypothetical protein
LNGKTRLIVIVVLTHGQEFDSKTPQNSMSAKKGEQVRP